MTLVPKLGRASSESSAVDKKLVLDIKSLWLDNSCCNTCVIEEDYINGPYKGKVKRRYLKNEKYILSLPFFYHFRRLFTTNTRATPPELIMDSQAANYCQVLPHSQCLTLLSWEPSIQEHGGEGWCACAGCDALEKEGVCMMSSCGMEGANQTLRKLCHLLLSRSIHGYRSAVN